MTARPYAAVYDEKTMRDLADLVECFSRPCLVRAPHLAQELHRRGVGAALFDDGDDVPPLPGLRKWSPDQPVYVADEFDFVYFDASDIRRGPVVFNALRIVAHFRYDTPIAVAVDPERAQQVAGALEPFRAGPQLGENLAAHSIRCRDGSQRVLLANFALPF